MTEREAARVEAARVEAVRVQTDDGWILRGERRPNEGPVVVLGHAMMVDRRTLDRPRGAGLASVLHARGLDVITFDARGHGQSGPGALEGASWTYDDIVRGDLPAMIRFARKIAEGRRVAVLGHSLVGHAAMITAGLVPEHAPDRVVGYGPNLWAPHLERSARERLRKGLTVRAWLAYARLRGCFDAPGLGLGSDAEAAAYVEEFVSMWARDRLAARDGTDYERALSRVRIPVLAYSSTRDRKFAPPASVQAFVQPIPGVEHRRLEGGPDHMGFVLSPTSRPIWEETAEWIAR